MKLTIPIPSLNGGVSTQPEPLRLIQQANRSDNTIGTVIEGLRVRPPSEFVGPLGSFPSGSSKMHAIHYDDGDYLICATNQGLVVYDAADPSNPKTLRNTSGSLASSSDLAYLATSDPARDLRFLTLNDYTLILNRTVTPAASSGIYAPVDGLGQVNVVSGSYSKYYIVKVSHSGGDECEVRFETYSSDGTPPGGGTKNVPAAEHTVKTDVIAAEIGSFLETGTSTSGVVGGSIISGLPGGLPSARWTISVYGSSIGITRKDGTAFKIEVRESSGGTSLTATYQTVQLFSDLPGIAQVGLQVKVAGDPENTGVGYWVKWVSSTGETSGWSEGSWEETVGPGVPWGLDMNTMPHALIRQANGEWQFTPLDGVSYFVAATEYTVPTWEYQVAGDAETNTAPAFIGKPILAMVFHESRLGLMTRDTLSLSETRNPFNFFRTTVLDVLDSDRIEIKLEGRSDTLVDICPLGADLVLFSTQIQYVVRAEGAWAPNSVSLVSSGRFDAAPVVAPIQVRDGVLVPSDLGVRGSVKELRLTGDARPLFQAQTLTSSAEKYLAPITVMATTPMLNLVAFLTTDPYVVYAYTFYFQNQDKVQQAWQRWVFEQDVKFIWFVDTEMWLVTSDGTSFEVRKMRLQPGADDDGYPLVHLDRRFQADPTTMVASGSTTTITLPYAATSDLRVIEAQTGKECRVVSYSGISLVVSGDKASQVIWVGLPFSWRHDLSRVYASDRNNNVIVDGTMRLDYGVVNYSEAGVFDVHVMLNEEDSSVARFTGPYLGMGANYQKTRVTSGSFKFPIRAATRDCRVSFRGTGPWGCRLVSAEIVARLLGTKGNR